MRLWTQYLSIGGLCLGLRLGLRLGLCLGLLSHALPSYAAESIVVKGLFKNTVVLVIDGKQVLLKKGKTQHGVTLISSSSQEAVLEVGGKRQTVGISSRVGGSYQVPTKKTVRISSQDGGHHWVRGQVNGRIVDFVVDTGASVIAMNLSTAKRLGIDYEKGKVGWTSTANGVKEVRNVLLNKVTVGEITQHNVAASIGLDDSLPVVLLGNSFLSQVNLRTEQGVLILESQ